MPISYIPSSQSQTPEVDPRGLVQLALAVHQSNLAESEQKKTDAMARIKMLTENPDLMTMVDPKKIQQDFKTSGFDLASPEQVQAMQKMIAPGGQAPPAPAPSAPVPSNQLEQLGATMQGNKAGVQSATPPSASAAAKAPGGGVTPGGIVTPGTGQLQQLEAGATDSFTKQVGALAPLYMGAAAQKQQQFMIAQKQMEIQQLTKDVQSGGPTAVRSFATLNMLNGKTTTADEMRAIWSGSDDPKVRKESIDYMIGNETGADLAKRTSQTLQTLIGSPGFMNKLKDPTDVSRIADSIVGGHGIPSDVLKKPMTLDEIKQKNEYEKQLVEQGFPSDIAGRYAEAQAMGIPFALTMPSSMHGLTIQQQEAGAKVETGRGMLLRGTAAMEEAQVAKERLSLEHDKITKSLDEQLKEKLENMLALQKGGVKIPQEMLDENLRKVAEQSGVSVERVSHWYNWLYMGSQLEAQGGPTSESALEGQKPVAPGAPTPRVSHQRNVSPAEAARIKSLRGSMGE